MSTGPAVPGAFEVIALGVVMATDPAGEGLPTLWAVEATVIQDPRGWHLGLPLAAALAHNPLLHGEVNLEP